MPEGQPFHTLPYDELLEKATESTGIDDFGDLGLLRDDAGDVDEPSSASFNLLPFQVVEFLGLGSSDTINLRDAKGYAMSDEEILGTLLAVAPIVGSVRLARAAPELARAIGYDIDRALEERQGLLVAAGHAVHRGQVREHGAELAQVAGEAVGALVELRVGERLVAARQRDRDHDALAHPAGHLVRIGRIADTRPGQMSALTNTGRSDALRKLELNGS